jgi:hypothetical protein
MESFKRWLLAQEASTDYLRNPGTREQEKNPFKRAAMNMAPAHIGAIQGLGAGFSNVIDKTMYPAGGAPSDYTGYSGVYEGPSDQGLTMTIPVPAEQVNGDIVLAKYLALKNGMDQLRQTGRLEMFDTSQAMIAKAVFLQNTTQGPVYPVQVVFPYVGSNAEKNRGIDYASEILAQRRDLPNLLPKRTGI